MFFDIPPLPPANKYFQFTFKIICFLSPFQIPGQKKWPFLPQNKFLFISACLASCKPGQEATKAASAGAAGLPGMLGVKGAFILPPPNPSPSASGVCPALPRPSVENHISASSGWLPGERWLKADVPLFSCERNLGFCVSRMVSDQHGGVFQHSLICCRCWDPISNGAAELRIST